MRCIIFRRYYYYIESVSSSLHQPVKQIIILLLIIVINNAARTKISPEVEHHQQVDADDAHGGTIAAPFKKTR
jgi:hypothetical protein